MPPFVTAHTFCASGHGQRKSGFLRIVPTNTKEFLRTFDYAGKADLSKGC